MLSLVRRNPSLVKSYFVTNEVPLTSKDLLESFRYCAASEPVDENSQSADSFMQQVVVQLEEGAVKMTCYNRVTHLIDATFSELCLFLLPCFQKKSLVIGNSEGVRGLKSPNF